jgi:hypothetical protein
MNIDVDFFLGLVIKYEIDVSDCVLILTMKPWSANGLVETGVGATGVRVDLLLVGTPWIRV